MRNISAWAIKHPVTPIVLFVVLTFLGIVAFIRLPINLNPDIAFPVVIVNISQPGAAPTEMETQIAQKVEGSIASIGNIHNQQSRITEGNVFIIIEFNIGTTIDRAVTDVRDAMQPISEALLRDYSATGLTTDFSYDTDHGPFLLEGIPALDLLPAEAQYNALHHKASDTFDKVDPVDAKADAAIVGMVTYVMADLPQPIARRISHKEVDEMLKKTGMYNYLTALGIWKP